MKRIVVIGGGTGLSSMLRGMKKINDVDITAIVTVADDGGSTGRIRDTYNIPAVGDIRHVMSAMAEDENENLFRDLLDYRFQGNEDVGGHNLGNLIFLALIDITGSFMGAIQAMSRVLNIKGKIVPSTLDNVTLFAMMKDGTLVCGEKNIPNVENSIDHVFYKQDVVAYQQALRQIEKADMIIYGIGSLYTSILPNLIIKPICDAIQNNPCPKVYFCNAMSQPGETDEYSLEDHIRAIEKHSYPNSVDVAIVNESYIPSAILARYAKENSKPVTIQEKSHEYAIMKRNLVHLDSQGRIRHNPDAVKKVIEELLKQL
ncbi:gluconeogenesis factor YvcK family protein [Floccifex sp.]|uniref:gluconeogenesis factor YvcK family protein n=1 Tax=Floccifex sp. TaxID=2815810 RepID=UPI002A74E019|nr:gluconeogenesis factor YvcK family protein [Floccifex sp.]MDD7280986.1 YvcK family protein [Erysipelotrichaceae bacterium]MDY2958940.1 gluconeogenesis factor YvcK family protein [Floccifex sp.]